MKKLYLVFIILLIIFGIVYAYNWNEIEDAEFFDNRNSSLADDTISILSSALMKTRRYYGSRLTIKDPDYYLARKYVYCSDCSGLIFESNELYAFSASDEEDIDNAILFVVRNKDDVKLVLPNIDYSKYDGKLLEPNLSYSNQDDVIFLTCYIYNEGKKDSSVIMALDTEFNVISDVVVNGIKFTGNTIITPKGYILHAGKADKLNIYKSNKVYSNNLSSLKFSKLYTLDSSKTSKEATIGYYNNYLVAFYRNDENSKIRLTTNKEGKSGWIKEKILDSYYMFPTVFNKSEDENLIFTALESRDDVLTPVLCTLDVNEGVTVSKRYIDRSLIDPYGYTSLVKHSDGYGLLYYDECDGDSSGIYLKDIKNGFNNEKFVSLDLNGSMIIDYINGLENNSGTMIGTVQSSNISLDYSKSPISFDIKYNYQNYKTITFEAFEDNTIYTIDDTQIEEVINLCKICGYNIEFYNGIISFVKDEISYEFDLLSDGEKYNTSQVEAFIIYIINNAFNEIDENQCIVADKKDGVFVGLVSTGTSSCKIIAKANGCKLETISCQVDEGELQSANLFKTIFTKKDGKNHTLKVIATSDDGRTTKINYNY